MHAEQTIPEGGKARNMSSSTKRLQEQSQVVKELGREIDRLFTEYKTQLVNPERNETEIRLKEKYDLKVAELHAAIGVSNSILYEISREKRTAVVQPNNNVAREFFSIRTITSVIERVRSYYTQPNLATKRVVDKKKND